MTRDDHRAKCIEAMIDARLEFYRSTVGLDLPTDEEVLGVYMEMEKKLITAAFDSLRGTARVNAIEATEEMINSSLDIPYSYVYERWRAMSAAGNLTKPPKKKL